MVQHALEMPPWSDSDDCDLLLSQAPQIDGSRALIVASHGLGLLRALIRRGCLAATCLRPAVRPEVGCHDLAFFPDVTPETELEGVVRDTLRAVVPGGRVVVRIGGDPRGRIARGLARRLKLNGFTGVRTQPLFGRTLIRADRPAGSASH
jgi:hypothetical protein